MSMLAQEQLEKIHKAKIDISSKSFLLIQAIENIKKKVLFKLNYLSKIVSDLHSQKFELPKNIKSLELTINSEKFDKIENQIK